jgi:hypothetical protein
MGVSETDFDVYKHEKRFQNAIRNLQASENILESNKSCILEFVQRLAMEGVGKARVTKYLLHMTVLARTTGQSFSEFARKDVEQLVASINSQSYTDREKQATSWSLCPPR